MRDTLILLTPLLVLIVVALFGFTGCGKPLPPDDTPVEPPAPQPPVTPPPPPETYAQKIAKTAGLVAHWPLNETAGTKALVQPAGLNLNGDYQPAATPGGPGAFQHKEPMANFAANLDGTGYVEVPFSPLLNPDNTLRFSVELWIKPAAAMPAGSEQIVISSHNISASGNHRGYEIALLGGGGPHPAVQGRVFSPNAAAPTIVSVAPVQGDALAWRHIAFTVDGSGGAAGKTIRLYVSVAGAPITLAGSTANMEYGPVQAGGGQRPLRFGAGHLQAGPADKQFSGWIDEVAFYNVELPQATVEEHFKLF